MAMNFLRRIREAIGKVLRFLIGIAFIFAAIAALNWITGKTLWPFMRFLFQSLVTESAHLTWLAKGSILLVMLFVAMLIGISKADFPRLYGWGEIVVGCVLAWQTMSKALGSNLQQNLALLLASVVILEKGMARVDEGNAQVRLEKKRQAAKDSAGAERRPDLTN